MLLKVEAVQKTIHDAAHAGLSTMVNRPWPNLPWHVWVVENVFYAVEHTDMRISRGAVFRLGAWIIQTWRRICSGSRSRTRPRKFECGDTDSTRIPRSKEADGSCGAQQCSMQKEGQRHEF
jgi:hypothetical protein